MRKLSFPLLMASMLAMFNLASACNVNDDKMPCPLDSIDKHWAETFDFGEEKPALYILRDITDDGQPELMLKDAEEEYIMIIRMVDGKITVMASAETSWQSLELAEGNVFITNDVQNGQCYDMTVTKYSKGRVVYEAVGGECGFESEEGEMEDYSAEFYIIRDGKKTDLTLEEWEKLTAFKDRKNIKNLEDWAELKR